MKTLLALLSGIALFSAPTASIACSPGPMSADIARKLDAVLIGTVTDSVWDAAAFQLSVKVKVDEAIKGDEPVEISAPFPCFRSVENGRRVIVLIKDGSPVAWHSQIYESEIHRILGSGR